MSRTRLRARTQLASILTTAGDRPAWLTAAIDHIVASAGLADIDSDVFGYLIEPQADPSVSATAASAIIHKATTWSPGEDIGKTVHLAGAGAAGATLVGTIVSVNLGDRRYATLSTVASTTVTPSTTSTGGLAVWGWAPGVELTTTPLPGLYPNHDTRARQLPQVNLPLSSVVIGGVAYNVVPMTVLACDESDVQHTVTVLTLVAE